VLLEDLFAGVDATLPPGAAAVDVRALAVDSRRAAPGTLFAALPGVTRHDSGAYSYYVSGWTATNATSSNAVLRVLAPQRLTFLNSAVSGVRTFASQDADGAPLLLQDLSGFELQVSTNLLNWSPLPGNLTLTNGFLEFRDTNSWTHMQRFYRILERVP